MPFTVSAKVKRKRTRQRHLSDKSPVAFYYINYRPDASDEPPLALAHFLYRRMAYYLSLTHDTVGCSAMISLKRFHFERLI